MNINARLAAIERKLGSKERPIILLFGDDPTPVPTAGEPAPIILHFDEDLRDL